MTPAGSSFGSRKIGRLTASVIVVCWPYAAAPKQPSRGARARSARRVRVTSNRFRATIADRHTFLYSEPTKLISRTIEYGTEMIEPWTSVDEIARHLGVAKDSIYRWIERRSLPAHRLGRLWKFKISEVDDWVRAGGAGRLDGADRATDDE